MNHAFSRFLSVALLATGLSLMLLAGSGCSSTSVESGFLPDNQPMPKGKHIESFWAADGLSKQKIARIFIEPVDISRIQDLKDVTREQAAEWLKVSMVTNLQATAGCEIVDQKERATATLAMAITHIDPGSKTKRVLAGEFGAGRALAQVDGKLTETSTGKEIVLFSERRGDTASAGFENVSTPELIKRMLEFVCIRFSMELAESAK